ncbi:hypothetical protein Tco_0565542 [Tanacetum coccineum]
MEAHLAPKPSVQVNKITSSCEICGGPHGTQICMENPEQAFVDYASSHNNEVGGNPFTVNQEPKFFNEAANAWKGRSNFNWARTQTFSSPQNGSFSTYSSNVPHGSSNYQSKIERVLLDFDSHQENREWGTSEQRNYQESIHLLSPKYQAQSSLGKEGRDSSSPKRVHFVNTITIIKKEDEHKETKPLELNAIESGNRDLDEKIVEIESRVSKIMVEKGESSDLGNNDKTSDLSKLGEEGE